MYTLNFIGNSLQLVLNDSDHTNVMILNQPFRPGGADYERKDWDSAGEALAYWNSNLSSKYPDTENNITIEVS
jgi:hypothetical protein